MEDVLLVADAGPVVSPFDLVEGGVGPFLLVAGVDDAVGAGDDQVGELDGHLVGVVVEELVDEGLVDGQGVDAFADGDVVVWLGGKDVADELDPTRHLSLSDMIFQLLLLFLVLQHKTDDRWRVHLLDLPLDQRED